MSVFSSIQHLSRKAECWGPRLFCVPVEQFQLLLKVLNEEDPCFRTMVILAISYDLPNSQSFLGSGWTPVYCHGRIEPKPPTNGTEVLAVSSPVCGLNA